MPQTPVDLNTRSWSADKILGDRAASARLRSTTTIFRAREHRNKLPEHGGPLSIKMVRSGMTSYGFGRRNYKVELGDLLMVPANERYTTTIERDADIVAIYIPDIIIREAMDVIVSPNRLGETSAGNLEFPTHHRRDAGGLRRAIEKIAMMEDSPAKHEQTLKMAGAIAFSIVEAIGSTSRIPAVKQSTRQELFRRVSIARQAIETSPETPLSLEELASRVAISPFHLLRAFTAAFGESPDQMRRRILLRKIELLLSRGSLPIGEIAIQAGFKSASSFGRAFRQSHGLAPNAYRNAFLAGLAR